MSYKLTSFLIREDVLQRVKNYCKRNNLKMKELIELALNKYLNDQERCGF